MIDESKRKKLIYASIIFGAIVILSFAGFLIFNKKDNLPPVDAGSSNSSEDSTNTKTSEETDTSDESSVFKNGIEFKKFNALSKAAVTDIRIDVVRYYLAQYAATQSTGAITTYTLDKDSIKTAEENGRQIYTFSVKDNNNTKYTVELSYIYAADAFVQIFDKNGAMIQSSPIEDHDE